MRFDTTEWSLVLAAGGDDASAARAALASLCETYWYPLYAYARRRGCDAEDARDLTQAFLASLIERRDFAHVDRERGRFRSFLLSSLQHFLANDAVHRRAQKRGGGAVPVPLATSDLDDAERRYGFEPVDAVTPETLYERRWAMLVIERVLAALRHDWDTQDRGAEFDELKSCLMRETPPGGYAGVAGRLGMSEGAVKVAVHRLRRKFQSEFRRTIAHTVADPADVDDEIRYLLKALSA